MKLALRWAALAMLLGVAAVAQETPETGESPEAQSQEAAAPEDESTPAPLTIDPLAGAPKVLTAQQLRGVPTEVVAFLLRAEPGGELALEVNAVPTWRQGGAKADLSYQVEIDGAALLDRGQGATGRVEVYVYALDAQSRLGDYAAHAFTVDTTSLGEAIWQSGLRLNGELALAPGSYRLRVLVRESRTKAAGLRELALVVPPAAEAFLSPPFFEGPQERDGWIPVRPARPTAGAAIVESVPELEASVARPRVPYPLLVENRPLIPAGLPVLVVGRAQTTHLMARGFEAPPAVAADLVTADGRRAPMVVGPVELLPTADPAVATLRFPVTAPEVAPGRWRLELRAGDRVAAPRDVLVLPRDTRERELLWTDLRWRLEDAVGGVTKTAAAEEPKQPESNKKEREENKLKVGAIAKDYRALLAGWPGNSSPTQVARLLELEGKILATERLKVVTLLQSGQLQVARELAAWDPEGLVPLIYLHFEAYLAYRQRQAFALLTHSRMLVDHLIQLYLEKSRSSEGARRLAALAQAGLALEAEEGSLAASSLRLYRKALELDPASRPALLGLASSEHRQNHSSEALFAYQQLVERYPELAEAHLRLGVLYQRLGRSELALESLERAAKLQAPAWVGRLVRQEKARLAIQAGDLGRAADALPQRPVELSEIALAAFVADQQGKLRRSLDLARGLGSEKVESARRYFDRVPPDEQRALRQELEKVAVQRIPITSEWAAKA